MMKRKGFKGRLRTKGLRKMKKSGFNDDLNVGLFEIKENLGVKG